MSITLQQLDAWAKARFDVSIEWNPHRASHMPLSECATILDCYDFVSDEARDQCFAADACVHLQVYPTNSVGFYSFTGRTLEEVVEAAWSVPELRPASLPRLGR